MGAGSDAVAATTMGVGHGTVALERLHDLRHGRSLLPDRTIDADQVVLCRVDDGIERDGGFACLAIADQQLALTAANRESWCRWL